MGKLKIIFLYNFGKKSPQKNAKKSKFQPKLNIFGQKFFTKRKLIFSGKK